jgi:hypothetical protein
MSARHQARWGEEVRVRAAATADRPHAASTFVANGHDQAPAPTKKTKKKRNKKTVPKLSTFVRVHFLQLVFFFKKGK